MRIGLPRALGYYEYGHLWRAFFEALGADVVTSGPTTRTTLDVATTQASAEFCLPVKVYIGHLLALAEEVDLVFVPSLRRPTPAATHCARSSGCPTWPGRFCLTRRGSWRWKLTWTKAD